MLEDVSFETEQLRQGAQHHPASTSHLHPDTLSSVSAFHPSEIAAVVKKRACDVRWEVRDSTLEFVGQLAKESDVSRALLEACCTTPLLREALQDTDSYVRASAISTLAKTLTQGWRQGAALSQEEVSLDWAGCVFVFCLRQK